MANPIAIPGTVVPSGALVTPGGAQGVQGIQGVPGPQAVSTDASNVATLGSDNLIYVPDPTPTIWSTRLRTYNAIQNPNFEIDQTRVGTVSGNMPTGSKIVDRWVCGRAGTIFCTGQQLPVGFGANLPAGSGNFSITGSALRFTLSVAEASMAAGSYWFAYQIVEGITMRELMGDVHSVSILAYTNVTGGLKFGLSLRDSTVTRSLVKLCTAAQNTWSLITLPNLPTWDSNGTYNLTPGNAGYTLGICLASGSNLTAPANDIWTSGNYIAAIGQDNFGSKTVGSAFIQFAFVQHEPGSVCTPLQDKTWLQNYQECQRMYCKSYDYDVLPGNASTPKNCLAIMNSFTTAWEGAVRFPVAMAKIPTVVIYSQTSGGANQIRQAGVDYAVNAVNQLGKYGFQEITTSGSPPAPTAGAVGFFQYTADTLW